MRHPHRYRTTRLITAEDRGWHAADGSAARERPKCHTDALDEATRRSARRAKQGEIVGDKTHLTPTEGAADHAAYIWHSRGSSRSRIQSPRKLSYITVRKMAALGKKDIHTRTRGTPGRRPPSGHFGKFVTYSCVTPQLASSIGRIC